MIRFLLQAHAPQSFLFIRAVSKQYRYLSSSSSSCPFSVLGIPKSSSYKDVKQAFVKLALEHHPDTAEKKKDDNTSFHDIRQAFESIVETDNGRAVLSTEDQQQQQWTDESLDEWFHQETGQHLGFHMNLKTRQQVAHVSNNMAPGGLDKGGMWAMADHIAKQQANSNGNSMEEDPLHVTSGRNDTITSTRRRRKK